MTVRSALAVVAVALLVGSAGCGGFDSSPEPDRDPFEVDEEFEPELLPGLTEDGVTDSTALADAHYRTLEDGPFRSSARVTAGNGSGSNVTVRETTRTVGTAAARITDEYRPAATDRDPETIVEVHVWLDGDVGYVRAVQASGNVTYHLETDRRSTEPRLPISLLDLYEATDTVTVEQTADAERYRLEGTGDLRRVENASFEVVLDPAGYVERYRVAGTQQRDGERTPVEYVGEFEPLDDPELEPPEWLAEAEDAVADRAAS